MITPYCQGSGVRGLTSYLTHDKATEEEPRPKSSERVAWTHTVNIPTQDLAIAAKIVQGQIYDAPALKAAAGIGRGGRKLAEPIAHWTLSWHPDQHPTDKEMLDAALDSAAALGLDGRPMLFVAHNDTAQRHVHCVGSRIDPENGRALKIHKPKLILSAWSADYEIARGNVVVPGRLDRLEGRARFNPDAPVPLPPMQRPRAPDGGPPHTEREVQEWSGLHDEQQQDLDGQPEQDQLAQRVQLSQTQARRRTRDAHAAAVRSTVRTGIGTVRTGIVQIREIAAGALGTTATGIRRAVAGGTALADRAAGQAGRTAERVGDVVADGADILGTAARATGRTIAGAPSRAVDAVMRLLPGAAAVAAEQRRWNDEFYKSYLEPGQNRSSPRRESRAPATPAARPARTARRSPFSPAADRTRRTAPEGATAPPLAANRDPAAGTDRTVRRR